MPSKSSSRLGNAFDIAFAALHALGKTINASGLDTGTIETNGHAQFLNLKITRTGGQSSVPDQCLSHW